MKEDKERKIFDAALILFAQYGFKKTTLEDVAAEVGMTKSNLYFYVANKRDLYEKTIGNALLKWRDTVAREILQTTDVVEQFKKMAELSYAYLGEQDALRAILMQDHTIFTLSPREDRFYEINQGAIQLIKDLLKRGIADEKFYALDVDHTAELLFSIYMMFLIKTYVKSEQNSARKMYAEGLKIIMRGLCKESYSLKREKK